MRAATAGMNGAHRLPHLRQFFPFIGVILVTELPDEGVLEQDLHMGASVVVQKRNMAVDLPTAVSAMA
jgi:hypothetical protein